MCASEYCHTFVLHVYFVYNQIHIQWIFFKYVTCFDIAFAKKEDTNAWLQDFFIILGAS